ncbi:MAG: carbohydrate binding domain-containing protein [Proteobacteria bacterium]|nr:carbohydrate binding domain-containing protein [Pseudomonadota bacterium]
MNKKVTIFGGWMAASLVAVTVALAPVSALAQDKASSSSVMRTPLLLANAGFEEGLEKWSTSPSDAKAYEFAVDTAIFHSGKQSMRIRSVAGEQGGEVYQTLPIAALRGKTVELSGWLKTDGATDGGAVLTLRVFGGERLLEYNLMHKTPVKGTTEWTRYSVPVKVSKNASNLEVGITLNSKGTVWADDIELNVISHQ